MDEFKILEEAIGGTPQKRIEGPAAPEKEPESNQAESHQEFKAAAEQTIEKPEPQVNKEEKPEPKKEQSFGGSIFDDLKKTTEEDENMNKGGFSDKLEDIAKEVSEGSQGVDSFTEAKIKAEAHIGLVDVGFSIVACFVLADFSDATYAKFSLSSERRKVLIQAMARMYQQMKLKTNPKIEVITLIAASYVPLIWVLFMTKKKRIEDSRNPQPAKPAYLPPAESTPYINIPTAKEYYDQGGQVHESKRGVKLGTKRAPYKKNG